VLGRSDNAYDANNNLVLTIARASLPSTLETTANQQANSGDVVATYQYDADSNLIQKDMGTQGAAAIIPQDRIMYGFQPGGYLVRKRFYNFDATTPDYFSWFAIDRERDGNTGLIYKTKDTAGIETNYTYDELGRVKDITPADAQEWPTEVEYVSVNKTALTGCGKSHDFTVRDWIG
jgi:YD repeat-containing protein